jgi:signal transduction histidine kinase
MMRRMTTQFAAGAPSDDDEEDQLQIRAHPFYTVVMIVISAVMNLAVVSCAGNYYISTGDDVFVVIKMFATLLALATPFLLLWRAKHPYLITAIACGLTALFQLDSLLVAFCIAGVVARRGNLRKNAPWIVLSLFSAFTAVLSDMLLPPKYSLWMIFFSNSQASETLHPAGSGISVFAWFLCFLIAVIETSLGVGAGLMMRNSAMSRRSLAQARSERQRADDIQTSLSNKQIADSIAAEAHDTLAHSLSLIAVNATTLGADVEKLKQAPDDSQLQTTIQRKSDDLRGQAAGALDEAHSIIDMLRHPDEAARLLVPGEETALTQEALDALFADVRESGTELRLWVDIRGLSALNPAIGKVAFRAVQEGLTNARRHAPGVPVSLSISVVPTKGITLNMTNPIGNPDRNSMGNSAEAAIQNQIPSINPTESTTAQQRDPHSGGNGLPGLVQRVEECKGTCVYGADQRGIFHLEVCLPFVPIS